jgi:peptidoglycan/xylan/chitin deacetylase (PgdA/CDA1 family)
MKSEIKSSDEENGKRETKPEARRKRIKRLKTVIILTVIILTLLSTVLCILLGIRVCRLQKQVEDLISIHIKEGVLAGNYDDYAYAATSGPGREDSGNYSEAENSDEEKNLPDSPETGNSDNKSEGSQDSLAADNVLPGDNNPDNVPQDEDLTDLNPSDSFPAEGDLAEMNPPEGFPSDIDLSEIAPPDGFSPPFEGNTGINNENPAVNGNTSEEDDPEVKNGKYYGKTVYLTFDDGPSKNTDEILDILAEYNVKATFFVNGRTDDRSKMQYKRIVDEGHTLGMHSYSHNYKVIYKNIEDFDKDFTKLWKLLYDTTGYIPTIFRFPGGSYNKVNDHGMNEFIKYLNERSIVYHDWNVVNGDATGEKLNSEQMLENVLSGVARKKTAVVLMHDTAYNRAMLDSLPQLLKELLDNGAKLLPIDENLKPIQQIKADSVK